MKVRILIWQCLSDRISGEWSLHHAPKVLLIICMMLMMAACDVPPLTPTPTRISSGPALGASPTVKILTSEELYGTSVAFGGSGQNNSTSAPLPSRDSLPPVIRATAAADGPAQIEVFLEDGTSVVGSLYSTGDALLRGPGLLLIGPDDAEWGDLPVQGRTAGITILVLPLRSTPASTDLRSLLTSLSELPTVDPSRLGVIVQGSITDAIFGQCAVQSLCDFTALIGPQDRDGLLRVFPSYQPRSLLLVAGKNDAASTTAAVALSSTAAQATTHMISVDVMSKDLLKTDTALITEIVDWVQGTLDAAPQVLPTIERG